VIDARGQIVDCNPAVAPLLRCSVDDAVGRDATAALAVPVDGLRFGQAVEIAADDKSRYYDVQAVDLPPSVAATGRLLLFRDVTTREELHALLRAEALTDDLTGLANRRSFLATLERELARADRCVGVLFLDIDGFKGVNDRHGHHAGDEILVATARRLTACVRSGDVVGRLGGDEFAVLLPDVDGTEVPLAIADRITFALREPIDVDGRRLTVTVSVGLHVASAAEATPESLLRAADRRMYLAKHGRAS
jgi:diguanylate cyclase (GGDEF)-like protein